MCALEKELQWALVMELEKPIRPMEQQVQKERNRILTNQQNRTTAEVHTHTYTCTSKIVNTGSSVFFVCVWTRALGPEAELERFTVLYVYDLVCRSEQAANSLLGEQLSVPHYMQYN